MQNHTPSNRAGLGLCFHPHDGQTDVSCVKVSLQRKMQHNRKLAAASGHIFVFLQFHSAGTHCSKPTNSVFSMRHLVFNTLFKKVVSSLGCSWLHNISQCPKTGIRILGRCHHRARNTLAGKYQEKLALKGVSHNPVHESRARSSQVLFITAK